MQTPTSQTFSQVAVSAKGRKQHESNSKLFAGQDQEDDVDIFWPSSTSNKSNQSQRDPRLDFAYGPSGKNTRSVANKKNYGLPESFF